MRPLRFSTGHSLLFILPASFLRNQDSDSDQSLNLSDVNVSLSQDKSETSRKLSRSDSWTFYDTTPSAKPETIDEIDKVSSVEEESPDKSCEIGVSTIDRTSYASNESHASIQNSLYENLLPPKVENWQPPLTSLSDTRQQSSKSLLFEFDPFARTSDDNVYSNYENNDLMLLEALLATNDSSSRASSTLELHVEGVDAEEEHEDEDPTHPGISLTPPEPPKRFDSLPKNEYDEVEGVEQPDKTVSSKNPPLLPKLAHLVTKKQPAVPPRKPTLKNPVDNSSLTSSKSAVSATTTATAPVNNVDGNVTSPSSGARIAEDHRKVSVIQKLRKLRQESAVHAIRPNVISFVKTGSKFLARTREHIGESTARSPRMERPKVNAPHNQVTHRGMVYR